MTDSVWIAGSDGDLDERRVLTPVATGVARKATTDQPTTWLANSDGQMIGLRVKGVPAPDVAMVVSSPPVFAPVVDEAALAAYRAEERQRLLRALARAKQRGEEVASDVTDILRAFKSKAETLHPSAVQWVTMHGLKVPVHPVSALAVIPQPEDGTVKHFNKVQHELFDKTLQMLAYTTNPVSGYAKVYDKITHIQSLQAAAQATLDSMKGQKNIPPDVQKKLGSAAAAISRGNQDIEALQHAVDVHKGKFEPVGAPVPAGEEHGGNPYHAPKGSPHGGEFVSGPHKTEEPKLSAFLGEVGKWQIDTLDNNRPVFVKHDGGVVDAEHAIGYDEELVWAMDALKDGTVTVAKLLDQVKGHVQHLQEWNQKDNPEAASKHGVAANALLNAIAAFTSGPPKISQQDALDKVKHDAYLETLTNLNSGKAISESVDGMIKWALEPKNLEHLDANGAAEQMAVGKGMQKALDEYFQNQPVSAQVPAAIPVPVEQPAETKKLGAALNKPQFEQYTKTLKKLEAGYIGGPDVLKSIEGLKSAIADTKEELAKSGIGAEKKASLGAFISRSNQSIAALSAALDVHMNLAHPAILKGTVPAAEAGIPTASKPEPAKYPNLDAIKADAVVALGKGDVSVTQVQTDIKHHAEAQMSSEGPALQYHYDAEMGLQAALEEFQKNKGGGTVAAPLFNKELQGYYDSLLADLKNHMKSVSGTKELLSNFKKAADAAKDPNMKGAYAEHAIAVQAALDAFAAESKPAMPKPGLGAAIIADANKPPIMPSVMLSPYHMAVYNNNMAKLGTGATSAATLEASIQYYEGKANELKGADAEKEWGKAIALKLVLAVDAGMSEPPTLGTKLTKPPATLPLESAPVKTPPPEIDEDSGEGLVELPPGSDSWDDQQKKIFTDTIHGLLNGTLSEKLIGDYIKHATEQAYDAKSSMAEKIEWADAVVAYQAALDTVYENKGEAPSGMVTLNGVLGHWVMINGHPVFVDAQGKPVRLPKDQFYNKSYAATLAHLQSGEATVAGIQAVIEKVSKNAMKDVLDTTSDLGLQEAIHAQALHDAVKAYTAGAQSNPLKKPAVLLSPTGMQAYTGTLGNLKSGLVTADDVKKAIVAANKKKLSNLATSLSKSKAVGYEVALAVFQGLQEEPVAFPSYTKGNAPSATVPNEGEAINLPATDLAPAKPFTPVQMKEYNKWLTNLNSGAVSVAYTANAINGQIGLGDSVFNKKKVVAMKTALAVYQGKSAPPYAKGGAPSATVPNEGEAINLPADEQPAVAYTPAVILPASPPKPSVSADFAMPVRDDAFGDTLTLKGAAGGTQGAKWYKDPDGKQWLVKVMPPDRVATEMLANAIYRRLGVPAPLGLITTVDGKTAFAHDRLEGELMEGHAVDALTPAQRRSLNEGFIADAYLGSWDVMGATGDNILFGKDGKANRIDAGSSLFFRAQGDQKEFPADTVGELKTMAEPGTQAGNVYSQTGLDEYTKQQATLTLNDRLSDTWIDAAVAKVGFSNSMATKVAQSLKGRRDYLYHTYQPIEAVTPEIMAQVKAQGIQGHGLSIGGTAIKGASMVGSYELAPNGKDVQLVAYGKLRTDAENVLWNRIKAQVAIAKTMNVEDMEAQISKGYQDPYNAIIMAAAITINHHMSAGKATAGSKEGAGDDKPNPATIKSFMDMIGDLDPNGWEYKHHEPAIKAILSDMELFNAGKAAEVKPVPMVTPSPPPPPPPEEEKKKPKSVPVDFDVKVTGFTTGSGAFTRTHNPTQGMAQRGGWVASPLGKSVGTAVHFETPEVEATYFPSGNRPGLQENQYSRQGYIELRSKDGSQETLRAGMARLGILNHDTTVRDAEEAYLSRLAWWLKKDNSAAYEKAHAIVDPVERLQAKRKALSTIIGVPDVTKLPEYDFVPKHDARGTTYWLAPVIAGKTDTVPDNSVRHNLTGGKSWPTLTGLMLKSKVTSVESTEGRLRKGAFEHGVSSTSDQQQGGGGHLFLYFGQGSGGFGNDDESFRADGRVMRRLDSFAHLDDDYGNLATKAEKRMEPGSWKGQGGSHRQANVAGGIGFDQMLRIRTSNESNKQKTIENLHKLGITAIGQAYVPGGIPLEKAIHTSGDS